MLATKGDTFLLVSLMPFGHPSLTRDAGSPAEMCLRRGIHHSIPCCRRKKENDESFRAHAAYNPRFHEEALIYVSVYFVLFPWTVYIRIVFKALCSS